jgi:hypothetical protein
MEEKAKNMKERSRKEKIKDFWQNFKENWIWVIIGFYIGITSMGWIEYFRGCFSLIEIVVPTLISPIFIYVIFYARKSNQKSIIRVIRVIGGGLALGIPTFLVTNYFLFSASWAPFQNMNSILRRIITIFLMFISLAGAACFVYILVKRQDKYLL